MSTPRTAFEADDERVFLLSAARETSGREADELIRQAANYSRLARYLTKKENQCTKTRCG